MGAGIARLTAASRVLLDERDADSAAKAYGRIERGFANGSDTTRAAALEIGELRDNLGDCELVIEAVPDDLALKTTVLREAEAVLGPRAILATELITVSGFRMHSAMA